MIRCARKQAGQNQTQERREVILDKLIFASLLLLLALTPLPYATVEAWSITLWELWIFATTLIWGILVAKEGRLNIAANPLALPMLVLWLVALAQLLPLISAEDRRTLSYDAYSTLQAAIKLLALILFFALFATFVNTDERRRLTVSVIIATVFVIALIATVQHYTGKLLWQRGAFGPFVNRNHFAGFLEMGIGLAGGLAISRGARREMIIICALITLILCVGLVSSGSRGGVLAMAAEAVFLALIAWTARPGEGERRAAGLLQAAATAVLFVATITATTVLVGSDKLVQNSSQLQTEIQGELPVSERFRRLDIWRATAQMIRDHPLIGVGLGAYQFAYTRYDPSSGAQRVEQAHSDYLQILADAGIIGGAVATIFLLLLLTRGLAAARTRKHRRRAVILGALTGCFAIAVHSFVDFNLQITANAQLFLALAALATPDRSGHR
jgi:O-antigen ligase